jgi:hypothetical protein
LPNPSLQDVAAIATAISAACAMFSAFAAFLTLAILSVAAIVAGGQLSSAEKSRTWVCLRDLSDKWSAQLIIDARLLIEKGAAAELKLSPADEDYYKILALANFFEDMGLLEKEGQLTLAQVADRFEPSILYYDEVLRPFFAEERKDDPTILSNFASLANKLRPS